MKHPLSWWSRASCVATLCAGVLACGGGSEEAPRPPPASSNVVGPAGGTLSFLGGTVTLAFAPGAVAADTAIDVQAATIADRHPAPLTGSSYELQPSGIRFAQPVRLTLRYDAAQVPADMDAQTLHIGKSTADGWASLDSTVDAAAGTVSADLTGFSQYGVIAGLHTWQVGAVQGLAARYFDWPDVGICYVATDPAGIVYVACRKDTSSTSPPVGNGSFVARLNVDLSVQWLRPLPDSAPGSDLVLRVDQSGNAYAAYTVSTTTGNALQVAAFNPNGSARSGFPVRWNLAAFDSPRGMAVDATGNVHVFGASNALNSAIRRGTYAVLRADGSFAAQPVALTLPSGPAATSVEPWDMGLDFAGNVYITSTWFGNATPAFGAHISSFSANTLAPRAGFPFAAPSRLRFFIARPVNSRAIAPLELVPVTGSAAAVAELTALDVLSGGVRPGFPLALAGVSLSYGAIDASSNTWQLGRARDAQNLRRVWLGSVNSSGQMRSGFPRIGGATSSSEEIEFDLAVDSAGTAYISGQQRPTPASSERRLFIVRQPAL